jgi:hypothetical protein
VTPNPSAPAYDETAAADVDDRDHATHRRTSPDEGGGDIVSIRRNLLLSGVAGVLAALLGLAFLTRHGLFDRPLGVLLLAIAALHLVALGSWRVPVLVADEQGIRMRIGLSWRGLPWAAIRQVVVEHAESPLREGRLVIVPRDLTGTVRQLDPLARMHLRWNRLWYDAPLSLPLGMTTLLDGPDLAGDLRALSDGRVDIADLRGSQLANLTEVPRRTLTPPPVAPASEDGDVALIAPEPVAPELIAPEPVALEPVVPAVVVDEDVDDFRDFEDFGFDEPVEEPRIEPVLELFEPTAAPVVELPPPPEDDLDEPPLPEPVSPLRALRRSVRADVRLERRGADQEEPASDDLPPAAVSVPDVPSQRRPGEIAAMLAGVAVAPAEDLPKPALGSRIAHAREMLDMSIEELSNRTMIRPHVLESIESDDFVPCGGDIYARGHLQSIARILGLSVDPLLSVYDEHYAQGPINARRVFEAELSSGHAGGMRATFGGPRWSLLISAVLCLTMIWGLARVFAGNAEQLTAAPPGDVAVQAANHHPITSPLMVTSRMTVRAAFAPANVTVRDRTGRILWTGPLALGGQRAIVGLAPFKVTADNAGAVLVSVRGQALGTVGTAGQQASKVFG